MVPLVSNPLKKIINYRFILTATMVFGLSILPNLIDGLAEDDELIFLKSEFNILKRENLLKRHIVMKSPEENFSLNSKPFLIVLITWSILFMLLMIACCTKKTEESQVQELFDGCTYATAYHKYLIKLKTGSATERFKVDSTSVMLDFLDTNQKFITRIPVTPEWLNTKSFPFPTELYPDMKMLKFIMYRVNIMPQVGACRVTHDCYTPLGSLLTVYGIEIRDLTGNGKDNVDIPIFQKIKAIGPDSLPEVNCFQAEQTDNSAVVVEQELFGEGITANLTYVELVLFLFDFTNIDIMAVYAFIDIITTSAEMKFLYVGLASCGVGFTITAILLFIYRSAIKRFYALNRGAGAWIVIRYIYLIICFTIGVVVGLIGVLMGSNTKVKEKLLNQWAYSLLVSVGFFIVLLSLVLVAMYFTGNLPQRRGQKSINPRGNKTESKLTQHNDSTMSQVLFMGSGTRPSKPGQSKDSAVQVLNSDKAKDEKDKKQKENKASDEEGPYILDTTQIKSVSQYAELAKMGKTQRLLKTGDNQKAIKVGSKILPKTKSKKQIQSSVLSSGPANNNQTMKPEELKPKNKKTIKK